MKCAAVNYAADKSRIRSELMKLAHVGERGEDGRAVFESPLSRLIGPCSSPSFCEAKSIRYPPPTTRAADFRAAGSGQVRIFGFDGFKGGTLGPSFSRLRKNARVTKLLFETPALLGILRGRLRVRRRPPLWPEPARRPWPSSDSRCR